MSVCMHMDIRYLDLHERSIGVITCCQLWHQEMQNIEQRPIYQREKHFCSKRKITKLESNEFSSSICYSPDKTMLDVHTCTVVCCIFSSEFNDQVIQERRRRREKKPTEFLEPIKCVLLGDASLFALALLLTMRCGS